MNTLTQQYLNAEYDELAQLSENVSVIRHRDNGRILIKKNTDSANADIYSQLAALNLRGMPRIFSVSQKNDRSTVLYEYIEGVTVQEYIERNGPMMPDMAVRCICDICDTLAILHSHNIIHRDITPSNIILGNNGICYIIDFGIARRVKTNRPVDTTILGTAGFASPEQFGFRQTDARSDIYSLGVLLNYMLTGKMPDVEIYSGYISAIISKCTEMEPHSRYGSVYELKQALNTYGITPEHKKTPVLKYALISLLVLIFALILPNLLFSESSLNENIFMLAGAVFCFAIPFAVIGDFFGIINKLAEKYEWRLRERIGIRCIAVFISLCVLTVINNIIQAV